MRSVVLAFVVLLACACSGDDDSGDGGNTRDDDAQVGESPAAGEGGGGAGGAGAGGTLGDGSVGEGDAASGAGGGAAGTGGDGDADTDEDADTAGSACTPTETEQVHDSMAQAHIAEPLPASDYDSRPPSHGPHCGTWGHYQVAYSEARPLPACNFLHSLEHGAVALLYNCPEGCSEIVEQLQGIVDAPPDDPDCLGTRVVLTPYAEMNAKVAAAAWGFTWTADCFDDAARSSLLAFIEAHLGTRGDAPEPTICSNGGFAP